MYVALKECFYDWFLDGERKQSFLESLKTIAFNRSITPTRAFFSLPSDIQSVGYDASFCAMLLNVCDATYVTLIYQISTYIIQTYHA